jgi:hypothetical protein
MSRIRRTPVSTLTPEPAVPAVPCPTCDRPLVYRRSLLRGTPPERFGIYECRNCGPFEYRYRTRTVRPIHARST